MSTHSIPYSGTQIDTAIGTGLGQGYGTCGTAAATTAKTATMSGYVLTKGGIVAVKFTNSVPANATLSINSQTAKPIYYRNSAITADVIDGGDTVAFMFDGSYYRYLCKDSASGGGGSNYGYVWQDGNGMVHISHEPTPMITIESLTVNASGTYTAESGYAYSPVIVPAGTAGTPTASKGTVSNHTISITPSVTNTTGFISGSTKNGTAVSVSASELVSGNINIDDAGTWDVSVAANAIVPSGTEGTPIATKGTVSANSVTVTPSVTNTSGYISGGTKTGVGVQVTARELVYGNVYIDEPGEWDVAIAATAIVEEGTAGTPTATKGSVSNHSISVTPSVTNVGGFISGGTKTGTAVTVSASELVSGAKSITANGTGIDVANYSTVNVNVSGGGSPILQDLTKNYTPTETAQSETVTADSGYDGLGSVVVNVGAISSSYVGSGITRRSSTDLSASGATVTAPAGYYASSASKSVSSMTLPTSTSSSATSGYSSKATISRSTSDQYINIPTGYNSSGAYYKVSAVANGSATPAASISGTSATVSTGTNTITLSKTVSNTPQVSAGYISSGTSGNTSVSLTASVTTKGATTYNTSSSDQTIASGTYLTGTQTIKAVTVSGLAANKILSGTTVKVGDANDDDRIASVSGSVEFITYYTGSSTPSSSLGNNGDIYLKTS